MSKKIKASSLDKKSVQNLSKINPIFLDTIYTQGAIGNLIMKVQLRKDIDTIYIENLKTGNLKMELIVLTNGK